MGKKKHVYPRPASVGSLVYWRLANGEPKNSEYSGGVTGFIEHNAFTVNHTVDMIIRIKGPVDILRGKA